MTEAARLLWVIFSRGLIVILGVLAALLVATPFALFILLLWSV